MKKNYAQIAKKYSKIFYYSTLLFPKENRENVFLIYAFVRTVDNYVDRKKPNKKKLNQIIKETERGWLKKTIKNKLVYDFVNLAKKNFPKKWVNDFLSAQKKDAEKKEYYDFEELKKFAYGVAGTIGLFLAKLLKLPKKTYNDAIKLGLAMQIINCCRDVVEDYKIKRIYLPMTDLKKYHLNRKNLLNTNNFDALKKIIFLQLKRAFQLEKEARKSFIFFEKKPLLAVKTAADLYHLIGKKIIKKTELIFNKEKLKPNIFEIIFISLKNFFLIYGLNKKN